MSTPNGQFMTNPQYLAGTQSVVYIITGPVTDPTTILTTATGGTPPAVCWDVLDGSVDREMSVDEVTNLNSGGYYEDVPTIKKLTISSLQLVQRSGGLILALNEGDIVGIALKVPHGYTYQANVRVNKITDSGFNAKAAAKVTLDLTSQRAYSVILSS